MRTLAACVVAVILAALSATSRTGSSRSSLASRIEEFADTHDVEGLWMVEPVP